LRARGLRELRVRDHGERARVEIGRAELELARERWDEIAEVLATLGFAGAELALYVPPAQRHRDAIP
jgi:PP-loop superfamily ATP-utilizing enzyme